MSVLLGAPASMGEEASLVVVDQPPREASIDAPRVTFGLRPKPGVALDVVATVVSVARDGVVFADDARLFGAAIDRDQLVLTLDAKSGGAPRPAVYDVTVRVGVGATHQDVGVRVRLPAAKLQHDRVTLERDLGFPWSRGRWSGSHVITLQQDTGSETQISNLTITQRERATAADGTQVGPWLRPSLEPGASLARSAPQTVTLEASSDDEYPPGTSRTRLEVGGDQLGSPLGFEVEVHARRGLGWFIALFAGGAVAGWLLRSVAKQVGDAHELALRAEEVIGELKAEQERLPGNALYEALEAAGTEGGGFSPERERRELRGAIDDVRAKSKTLWRRPQAAQEAVKRAEAVVAGVVPFRSKLAVDGIELIRRERGDLTTAWRLPKAIGPLDEVRKAWGVAQTALHVDDLVQADHAVADAVERARVVRDAAAAWVQRVKLALEEVPLSLPPVLRESLDPERAALAERLQEPAPKVTQLGPILTALDDAEAKLRALAARLRRALRVLVHDSLGALTVPVAAANGDDPAGTVRRDWTEARRTLERVLPPDEPTDGEEGLAALATSAAELKAHVERIVAGAGLSAADAEKADAAVAAGHYPVALRLLTGARARAPWAENMNAVADVIPSPQASVALAMPTASAAPGITLAQLFMSRRAARGNDALVRSFDQVLTDHVLRATLAAVGIGALTWVAYAKTWTGTLNESVVIFAIAFASDYSLEALTSAFGRSRGTAG